MDTTTEALYASFSPNGLVNQGFAGMRGPHITAGTWITKARLTSIEMALYPHMPARLLAPHHWQACLSFFSPISPLTRNRP